MDDDQLAKKAEEQLVLHRKESERHDMKVEADKYRQNEALQKRLKNRLKERQENKSKNEQKEKVGKTESVTPPFGEVNFGVIRVKDIAVLLESTDEETALKTLEDISTSINEELSTFKIYKVSEDVGKFFIASMCLDNIINFAIKTQKKFNEHKWHDSIVKLPGFKKMFRSEDIQKKDAVAIFNGPRLSFGIHSGEASMKLDSSGDAKYSGINVIKAETIGNLAQGGQILLSATTWETFDQSKLSPYHVTQLGVCKLEGFSSACQIVEVLPASLKDRSKFFGSVCAYCTELIKPNEKFFKALDCIWHLNHFRCFQCNVDLKGSYLEYEGSPFCKNCYLTKTAPKCKNCSNPVTAGYINALQAYWHVDCFACKKCLKKPSSDVTIYDYDGFPYCGECYQQVAS